MTQKPASNTSATIAFAGGYSAGHLTPGLALAERLKTTHPHLPILFFGSPQGPEAALVAQKGFPFAPLVSRPFVGRRFQTRLQALANLLPAFIQARHIMKQRRVAALCLLGSHVCVAPALAAWSLRIPTVLLEANYTLGLASGFVARGARHIYTTHLFSRSLPIRLANKRKTVGIPLAEDVRRLAGTPRTLPPPGSPINILVLAGSRGHPLINTRVPALLARLNSPQFPLTVTHQCGLGIDPQPIRASYTKAGLQASVDHFLEGISIDYEKAHFVISAAGAITLHEVALTGLPALFLPLEQAAANHQAENARLFAGMTGGLFVAPGTWPEEALLEHLSTVLSSRANWLKQVAALRTFSPQDATDTVLKEMLDLAYL